MKFQEVRHLDGLKGFLGIVDGRLLTSTAHGQEGKTLSHMVVTTVRVFVEQQQNTSLKPYGTRQYSKTKNKGN